MAIDLNQTTILGVAQSNFTSGEPIKTSYPLTIFCWANPAFRPITQYALWEQVGGGYLVLHILTNGARAGRGNWVQEFAYNDGPWTLGDFNSFCGVWDQTYSQCYINAIPGVANTEDVNIPLQLDSYFGSQVSGLWGFEGCLAAFVALNWRLTDAEVLALHNSFDPITLCINSGKNPTTDILGLWRMDDKASAANAIYGPTLIPSTYFTASGLDCPDAPTNVPALYGSLAWEKRTSGGGLIGGATFSVTPDPFNLQYNTDTITVTDNDANDADLTDGQFLLNDIANLRTYTVTEIEAPEGYDIDVVDFRTVFVDGDVSIGTIGVDDEDDFHNTAIEFLVGGNSSQMCTNLLLYVPHTHELDKAGLKSFLEIGPFRFAEQQQADETSMVSSLIVGSTDAEVGIVMTLDLNTSDLPDEDWDTKVDVFGDDIAVDWGIGGGNSDDYKLRLFSHDDGMDHHTLGMPEALESIEDLGSAKVYAPYGFSGIWHRFRFEADEEDEGFQIKYIDVGGTLTGRRL